MTSEDPPRRPQLALPVSTMERAAATLNGQHTARADATSDLITIAFFFLLRVGEYTFPKKNAKTRTVQFRRKDIRLWLNGRLLSHELPLHTLLLADSATMYIEDQKNGHKGDTLHHTAVRGAFCPVKALARRVFHTHQLAPTDPATPLSLYNHGSQHVLSADINSALKRAARDDGLHLRGYDLSRIGPHSLRASGAMACKLNGIDTTILQKLGRWTSTTFMVYIHAQIANLTNGVAQRMATRLTFTNVGG
jgi:integrase